MGIEPVNIEEAAALQNTVTPKDSQESEAKQENQGDQEGSGGITLLQVDRVKAMREARSTPGGVVSWSPPQQNWNTWMGCNIGEPLV